jgi:hypothetical protein
VSDAGEEIIRQGIQQLKDGNARANAELNANLQFQRDKLSPGVFSSQSIPVMGTADDGVFMYQRQQLMASLFTSEVVAAAVLDPEFKLRVQAEAQKILVEKGLLPAGPVEPAAATEGTLDLFSEKDTTGPAGPDAAEVAPTPIT